MKFAYVLFAALLAAAPSQAAICIDPHWDYQAHWLAGHDIVARQTLGHGNKALKISTTCINLEAADTIRLSTSFGCIGMGDDVFASKIDGHRQRCRISHIEPYAPGPSTHG